MSQLNKNRIFWQSRRGMLELDLLLEPFVRHCYDNLTTEEQQLYQEFLAHEDQELYDWLLLRKNPIDKSFDRLIRLILENPNRSS